MATRKPDPSEIVNPKRTLARREEEAGLSPTNTSRAPAPAPAPTMTQAGFSGYDRAKPRAPRPSEAELEAKIAAGKKK